MTDLSQGVTIIPADEVETRRLMGQAIAHHAARRVNEAQQACRRVLELRPRHTGALNLLGAIELQRKRPREAEALFAQAVAAEPANAELLCNWGTALHACRKTEPAMEAFAKALKLAPNRAATHLAMGTMYSALWKLDESYRSFLRAAELTPTDPVALCSLSLSCLDRGEYEQSLHWSRQAIARKWGYAAPHLNYGLALLLLGDFAQGWVEYEWRHRCPGLPRHNFRQPQWDGSDLGGRTLLVYCEQGVGDALQFIRFAKNLRQRNGKLLVICHAEIQSLVANVPGVSQAVAKNKPIPRFDTYAPLLSLGRILAITPQTIPADVPYITPAADLTATWRQRLSQYDGQLKVGIVWAGSPGHRKDYERSCGLAAMAPLASVNGVTFFSLQKGAAAKQLASAPAGMKIVDLGKDLRDFADTAAALANLDLLITVDTSVAHLAGAMGKETWILLPTVPDWRWLLGREDSPWYPTVRLLRQSVRGDWSGPVQRACEMLVRKATFSGSLG